MGYSREGLFSSPGLTDLQLLVLTTTAEEAEGSVTKQVGDSALESDRATSTSKPGSAVGPGARCFPRGVRAPVYRLGKY